MDKRSNDTQKEAETKRIVIVDDHPLLRRALRELIQGEPDLDVCGEAANGHRAVQIVEQQRPDLVILDLSLKNSHGLDLIGQVRTRSPSTHVLILSMFDETVYAERCLRAGADGYIQKQDEVDKILEGVRTVLAGGLHISEELSSRILRRVVDHRTGSEESKIASLSNRELQLLELIGRGMTTQEIADILNLSTKTIHTYREHLKEKLDVDNVHQLVRYAVLWVLGKER